MHPPSLVVTNARTLLSDRVATASASPEARSSALVRSSELTTAVNSRESRLSLENELDSTTLATVDLDRKAAAVRCSCSALTGEPAAETTICAPVGTRSTRRCSSAVLSSTSS
ncbi:hypothetical protein ACFPRL_09505 [Pseudoclavibacter helvolus]